MRAERPDLVVRQRAQCRDVSSGSPTPDSADTDDPNAKCRLSHRSRSCRSLRGAFCGSSLQELAFPHVLGQRRSTFELVARLLRPAELPQEVAADGRQQVVRLERGLGHERVHKFEACSRTERHPHCDRPVQLDDRRRRELRDRIVKRHDARPIRLRRRRRPSVAGGDRRLQGVGTQGAPEPLSALERLQAAANEQAIPARSILIE